MSQLDDPVRLALLEASGLLHPEAVQAFERVARLAARALNAPIAQVNLVTDAAQLPRGTYVTPAAGDEAEWRQPVGLDRSYCKHVVGMAAPLVITDSRADPRVRDSPATTEAGIAAYAGVPLRAPAVASRGEQVLGSVCVVDFVPRNWTLADLELLEEIATGAAREVAGRLEAEDSLVASEARYRALAHAVGEIVWTTSADGRADEMPEWRAHTGQGEQEVKGWGWLEALHPDDRKRAAAAWRRAVEAHGVYDTEHRIRGLDGSYRWFHARGVPVVRDGATREWVGCCIDIEGRKRAEAALRAREAEFRAVADNIPQLAWMADHEGSIYWYNRRWYDFTGTTLEEMRGWGWTRVHHPDHLERVVARLQRAWDTGEPWEDTFPICSRDGEWRWFLSRAEPIRDERGRVIRWFGTNTDITALREAQAERERLLAAERDARAEAEAANEAKNQFLAVMSHELRTPLNAIQGHVQLVEMGIHGPVTPAQQEALARVQVAQRHLLGIIGDVLDYARLEAERMEYHLQPTRLADLLRSVTPLAEPKLLTKGLVLDVSLPEDPDRREEPIEVWADPERLRQLLLHLLSNAAKFTAPPAAGDGPRSVRVELAAAPDSDELAHLHVRDPGIGIPADRLASIFDAFVQVEGGFTRTREGTGLGLAISRELARGMGGELAVKSKVGEGSTFTVVLRRVTTAEGRPVERRAVAPRRRQGERRSGRDRRDDPLRRHPEDAS